MFFWFACFAREFYW